MDSISESVENQKTDSAKPKGITRRKAIKLLGLAAGASLTPTWINWSIDDAIGATILNPDRFVPSINLIQKTHNALAYQVVNPELTQLGIKWESNPDQRPMHEIIEEGIRLYELQSGKRPYYSEKPSKYDPERKKRMMELFAEVSMVDVYNYINFSNSDSRAERVGAIISSLQNLYGNSVRVSSSAIKVYKDVEKVEESGFQLRVRKAKLKRLLERLRFEGMEDKQRVDLDNAAEEAVKKEVVALGKRFQKLFEEKDERLSSSYIFAHFLEENAGNIQQSIYDTAIFLKLAARNFTETGVQISTTPDFNEDRDVVIVQYLMNKFRWLKDEYSMVSGHFMDNASEKIGIRKANQSRNTSNVNMFGLPYHAWNIIALLADAPIEYVAIATVGEYATFTDHGVLKPGADLNVLSDLPAVEKIIQAYIT